MTSVPILRGTIEGDYRRRPMSRHDRLARFRRGPIRWSAHANAPVSGDEFEKSI